MENKYWTNYAEYKKLNEYTKYLESKWWAWTFYGIHPWKYPELEEFESSNKHGSISLKDSSKVSQGTGHSALLSGQKGSDILQDKTMHLSGERIEILSFDEYR